MTVWTAILVAMGASVGSVARYEIGRWFRKITSGEFPWGTWFINVLGSLLLGLFYQQFKKLHSDPYWWLTLGTGFCGAFTTFSTMSVEAVQLFKSRPWMACAYLSSSFACGFILVWITQWT